MDAKEKLVLLQLLNYKTEENHENLVENPFYDDLIINRVAKTLSDLIYQRKTIATELIKKWTCGSHLIIETNENIFLNTIFDIKNDLETIQHPKIDCKAVIKKKYEYNLQMKIKCGLIDLYNKKLFENRFDVNIPLKPLQNNAAERLIDFFEQLDEPDAVLIDQDETVNKMDINLVLAIIKLNNQEYTIKLIEYLIKNNQNNIIKDIWNERIHLKLCDASVNVILKQCSFITEKVILEYFTIILNGEKPSISPDILEYIPSNLLDSILVLSNYDKRVLVAINCLKNGSS